MKIFGRLNKKDINNNLRVLIRNLRNKIHNYYKELIG